MTIGALGCVPSPLTLPRVLLQSRVPILQRGCANEPWPGGTCVWDKQHACDPDVVAAAGWPSVGFVLDGKPYQFAMFYLGIHQDSASGPGFPPGRPFSPVEANHIGVAVAESLDGPWFKKSGPVIIGARARVCALRFPLSHSIPLSTLLSPRHDQAMNGGVSARRQLSL